MEIIVICKEREKIYSVEFETLNIELLKHRSRLNADLNYYILKIDRNVDISPEAYIETIKRHPRILEKSDMIEKL